VDSASQSVAVWQGGMDSDEGQKDSNTLLTRCRQTTWTHHADRNGPFEDDRRWCLAV